MSDEIRLVLPAEEDFRPIAHFVVGGLGARLDLTLEHLEDLQVAVEALLQRRDDGGEVVIAMRVHDGALHTSVGPFAYEALVELESGREETELGLRRVLETVCDSVEVDERRDGAWVELTKRTAMPAGAVD